MTTNPADMSDEELADLLASFPRRTVEEMTGVTQLSRRQVESIESFIDGIEGTAEEYVCRRSKYDEDGLADAAVRTTQAIKTQCEALRLLLASKDPNHANGFDSVEIHTAEEWAEKGMRVDRGRPCRFDRWGDGQARYATWAVRPFKPAERRAWERKKAAGAAQEEV